MNLRHAAIERIRAWSARRHGLDALPLTVHRRRIYIVPTRFGMMLAALLAAMLVAGLNYNSNLALIFTFLMMSLGLVAMHHCHRNLLKLSVDVNLEADAVAGGDATFAFMLRNESRLDRWDIEIHCADEAQAMKSVSAHSREEVNVNIPVTRRGILRMRQFELRSRYPFGWFRAWTYVQAPLTAFVAPLPLGERTPPPAAAKNGESGASEMRGDEEFSGLRSYTPGVALKHMAWKVLARGGEAAVRSYTDLGGEPEWLDWSALEGLDPEARLSQLCRWILQSESRYGRPYGLKIPGVEIVPARGGTHRALCLRALACYAEQAA
jgi:uncharacterized protein (DUF58 family)